MCTRCVCYAGQGGQPPAAERPLDCRRRPAVRGALKGCLALLSRRGAASGQAAAGPAAQQQQEQLAEVEDAAAVALVRTAVSHVFIRALSQPDRALALRLLLTAMGGYGGAVLQAGLDLLDYLISSGGCCNCRRR